LSVEELKEKVDYVSLLFRQIDRCCASKSLEDFCRAVEHLRILCVPFYDQEFLESVKTLNDNCDKTISELENSRDYWRLPKEEMVKAKNQIVYERYIGLFRAIIDLLNRKGVIIERLRVGKE